MIRFHFVCDTKHGCGTHFDFDSTWAINLETLACPSCKRPVPPDVLNSIKVIAKEDIWLTGDESLGREFDVTLMIPPVKKRR